MGGFVPALLFGVAVGNVLQGVPFHFDISLRAFYTGSFIGLVNPFGLLCGFISVVMLAMHGAFFINVKTEGLLQQRSARVSRICALITIVLFMVAGIWLYTSIDGYRLISAISHNGPSNPLYKSVARDSTAWFSNYQQMPLTMIAPITGLVAALLATIFTEKTRIAFMFSAASVVGIIATFGISMFPFILPSSTHPEQSLMVWDSSSSHTTLFIMLIATLIFFPLILSYTAWAYHVMRGKVTEQTIHDNQGTAY